ncbi:uncharacterized protein CPUR_08847 [Claviceps purpurea 20.1]|uniref:Uncharacterized protein n=1 Tax=Claviceps purpurea (strain 20.1) TaxID=1111077 RepID=M1WGW9_CLAP2|nr:uncharacterized protein CPUR_08847 [Claviceps purpurea 20.1]
MVKIASSSNVDEDDDVIEKEFIKCFEKHSSIPTGVSTSRNNISKENVRE